MNDEAINVALYGDGSRNARLRAEYIYCDRHDMCSAYAHGKCFGVTIPFGNTCPYEKVRRVDGGTKHSKAYLRVTQQAKNNPKYHALRYPINDRVTTIGDEVYLVLPYADISYKDGRIEMDSFSLIKSTGTIMPADALTPEVIMRICNHRPRRFGGEVIENYADKTIPAFFNDLKERLPDKYEAFRQAYPDYEIKEMNYTGRFAKLSTIKRESTVKDAIGNRYHFDGDWLVCEDYRSAIGPIVPFGESTEIRIKITDGMKTKIESNSQVTENTVFVD